MKSIEESLTEKLTMAFQPEYLQVQNDSHGHTRGNETHFTVVVVSKLFDGKSRVDRQRMVASLFEDERARGLHALSQKTFTSDEWAKVKDQFELDPPSCRGGDGGSK